MMEVGKMQQYGMPTYSCRDSTTWLTVSGHGRQV
jgi:hypothetical protein